MSFFQILTEAYNPYREKLVEGEPFSSILNIAYDGCHRLVAHTTQTSTKFRQKTCFETMLFLIAVELKHIEEIKNKDIRLLTVSVSISFSNAIKNELKQEITKVNYSISSFIQRRIEEYIDMLSNLSSEVLVMLSILLLEMPLAPISSKLNDNGYFEYEIDDNDSQLKRRLDKLLQAQSLIALEVTAAREEVKKMYRMT